MTEASQSLTPDTQLFRDVFNASPIGIAVENLEGQPLFVNPAFCSMLGFSEEELRNKHCLDFSPPEDADKDWALFQQLQTGAIDHYQLERRYFRRDGSLIWGNLSVSLLKSRPSPLVLAMVEEITEKKKAEEARFRYAAIVESSEDAIGSVSLDGVIVSWNAGAQRIYGYTEAEAVGKSVNILVPPELYDEEKTILETLRAGGRIEHYETLRVTKTGKRINVSLSVSPIKDSSGKTIGLSGIARDISELKRHEQELRTSEERLRLAQQAAHIGTFEWNIRTGVNTWTPELEVIYGLPPGGFGGTQEAFENLVHPDDRSSVMKLVDCALKTRQPTTGEWRVVWRDGSVHWIAGRWQVFMDASGKPLRMIGVNIDVTERKRSEDRLREYEEAVEGAEDVIGVIDREYRLLLANRQYLKMRNLTREQVVGHFASEILGTEVFETAIKPKLDECFEGKVVKYEMRFSYPTVGERDLSLSYFPIEGPNGIDRAVCILRDITDHKRNEQSLRDSEQRFRLAAQAGKMYSFEWDVMTDEVVRSSEPAKIFGLTEPLRSTHQQFVQNIHSEDRPRFIATIAGLTPENPTAEVIYRMQSSDGGLVWLRSSGRAFFDDEGRLLRVIGMVADITEIKRAEEALAGMTRKLIESQEQERTRIARDLHDDVAQRIALLCIALDRLQHAHMDSEVSTRIGDLRRQTDEILADVQSLSHELHSSRLEHLGIVAAMRNLSKEFGGQQKMEVIFQSGDLPSPLPPEVSISLFRVLQEALRNAAKHSGVKNVEVRLHETTNEIHLTIGDSGRGFDVATAMQGRGLGLTSMQERIRLVNGAISIESKPMGGTTIHVRVPLGSEHGSQRAAG